MNEFPKLVEDVEVNEVADGYIVYQPERDRVHYLNHTAVLVLELCTGDVGVGEMPTLIQEAYEMGDTPTAAVKECLDKLFDEGIIA
jgi:hypothetical protein